jgi:hypothetical protein
MLRRQLPPRYVVHSEEALPRTGDESEAVSAHDVVQEREATTLAGARSIQRALQRRGYCVHGVYERIHLRISQSLERLVCGKLAWEWDGERPVDE